MWQVCARKDHRLKPEKRGLGVLGGITASKGVVHRKWEIPGRYDGNQEKQSAQTEKKPYVADNIDRHCLEHICGGGGWEKCLGSE